MSGVAVTLEIVLVAFLAILLSVLAMATMKKMGFDLKDFKQRTSVPFLSIAGIFNLAFIGVVAVVMTFINHQPLSRLKFGMSPKGWVEGIAALLITLLIAFVFVRILKQTSKLTIKVNTPYFQNVKQATTVLFGFLILFVAALQEEVMFRGYFIFVLNPYGLLLSAIVSTLIFTVWHFLTNKVTLFQTLDWLLGGIMFFYVYVASGSIWVAAIVHFSRNFTNVLVFNIAQSNSLIVTDPPIEGKVKTIYTLGHSLVMILLTYFIFGWIS